MKTKKQNHFFAPSKSQKILSTSGGGAIFNFQSKTAVFVKGSGFFDRTRLFHSRAKLAALVLFALTLISSFLTSNVLAEGGESASYNLDYGRLTNNSDHNESGSYILLDSVSDISVDGSSDTYQMHNVYAGEAAIPFCGNGVIEPGEQCDGANFGGLTCNDYGYDNGNLQCVACSIVTNACFDNQDEDNDKGGGGGGGNPPICGDGIKEFSEQCDDGNQKGGDGCSAVCKIENPEDDPVVENDPEEEPENDPELEVEPDPEENPGLEFDPDLDSEPLFPDPDDEPGDVTDVDKTPNPNSDPDESDNDEGDSDENQSLDGQDEPHADSDFILKPRTGDNEYHLEQYSQDAVITVLDETPFFVTTLEPGTHYELLVYDKTGELVVRQGGQSDMRGTLMMEVVLRLDYENYHIEILDTDHKVVQSWNILIEDPQYNLHENLYVNGQMDLEQIYLGVFERMDSLSGRGKANTTYHAYLQELRGENEEVPSISHYKVLADYAGDYDIEFNKELAPGTYTVNVVQVYEDSKVSRNKRYFFTIESDASEFTGFIIPILISLVLITVLGLILKGAHATGQSTKKKKKTKRVVRKKTIALFFILGTFGCGSQVRAVDTTPAVFVYEGKLLDAANNPILTAQEFRFSLWSSDDLVVGDIVAGAINVGAPAYSGWQEEHTITPNTDGTFFIELGSNTLLPDMDFSIHKFLMVEIKDDVDPDTDYELMDPTGDNGVDANDRQTLGSTPYTNNADFIDNAELGTGFGDIATLGVGDVWDITFIPEATNADSWTIDNDNDAVNNIDLVFGNVLGETLSFDILNDWFEFSNDVSLGQNELKDVALDNLPVAPGAPVPGQIYHDTGDGNTYVWNGLVWEDITAAGGSQNKSAVFHAEYSDSTVGGDGADNRGTLTTHFVDEGGADKYNYYEWLTSENTLQDVDVTISFRLPEDFQVFTGAPLSILYRSSDGLIANNQIDVELYDTTGAPVALVGGSDLASATWATENITFGGVPTFNAGDVVTLRLKMQTLDVGYARIADIIFNYIGT